MVFLVEMRYGGEGVRFYSNEEVMVRGHGCVHGELGFKKKREEEQG